jgi:hypothetical protein
VAGALGLGAAGWLLAGSALAEGVKGTADNLTDSQLTVAGKVIRIEDTTRIEGQLLNGSSVEVKTRKSDGALVAVRIHVKETGVEQENSDPEDETVQSGDSVSSTELRGASEREEGRHGDRERDDEREGDEDEPGGSSAPVTQPTPPPSGSTSVSFSATIQPLLSQNCASCHSGQGVNLSTYAGARSLTVPGNPAASTLYSVVASGRMPPNGTLSQTQMQAISDWIYQGAQNN